MINNTYTIYPRQCRKMKPGNFYVEFKEDGTRKLYYCYVGYDEMNNTTTKFIDWDNSSEVDLSVYTPLYECNYHLNINMEVDVDNE